MGTTLNFDCSLHEALECWIHDERGNPSSYPYGSVRFLFKSGVVDGAQSICELGDNTMAFANGVVGVLRESDYANSSVSYYMSALWRFSRYLAHKLNDQKLVISRDLMPKIRVYNSTKVKTTAQSPEYIRIFFEKLKYIDYDPGGAMLLVSRLCYESSARISSILELEQRDLETALNTGTILITPKKLGRGAPPIEVCLPSDIMPLIEKYLDWKAGAFVRSSPLFWILRRVQGGIVTKDPLPLDRNLYKRNLLRIDQLIHPHVFRASRITHLKDMGVPIDMIMSLTGHRSIQAVDMYDKNQVIKNASHWLRGAV